MAPNKIYLHYVDLQTFKIVETTIIDISDYNIDIELVHRETILKFRYLYFIKNSHVNDKNHIYTINLNDASIAPVDDTEDNRPKH